MEKPAVKNIPSSFKRFWALQVPSLQNKLNWDNCYYYYNRYHFNLVIWVNGAKGANGVIGVIGVNGMIGVNGVNGVIGVIGVIGVSAS